MLADSQLKSLRQKMVLKQRAHEAHKRLEVRNHHMFSFGGRTSNNLLFLTPTLFEEEENKLHLPGFLLYLENLKIDLLSSRSEQSLEFAQNLGF